jgi:exodeoxyribonuclease-3
MRILSWNVERLKAGAPAIADEILRHKPDVVALQEFQPGRSGIAVAGLFEAEGFSFRHDTPFGKGFCSVIFSRVPAEAVPTPDGLPPDNWSSYWTEATCGGLGVSCLHIPIPKYAAHRKKFWDTALRHSHTMSGNLHLLIGDLNTTRHGIDELGTVVSGDHWLRDLEAGGWNEAWRTANSDLREYSWYSKTKNGFRVDQAWLSPTASRSLSNARMDHVGRMAGLSDHSMLIVDLDIPGAVNSR